MGSREEAQLLEQVKSISFIDEINIDSISLGPKDYARSWGYSNEEEQGLYLIFADFWNLY